MTMVIEILLYKLKPQTGDAFHALMRNVSVPLHHQHGLDVVWHGQSLHDRDGYGLVRAFADLPTLESTLAAFYASSAWRSGPREDIIDRIETSTRLVMPMQAAAIEAIRQQGILSWNAADV